jgi:hypothetical protein
MAANGAEGVIVKKVQSSFAFVGLLLCASVFAADVDSDAGMFAKGRKQFTALAGSGNAFDNSYFIIGVGGSYFVADGLNVGVNLEAWTSGDPGIYKIAASMNYIFYQTPRVKPYVGVFYRYTDIQDHDSLNSVGGRAGVYIAMGRNGHAGFGGVYESYLDCGTHTGVSCSTTYPEISFIFSF